MTELKPIKNVFAVEVPEGRDFDFRIDCNNEYETDKFCTVGMLSKNKSAHRFVEIPYGSYEIICTTKGVTEKQASGVVERLHAGGFGRSGEEWKNYNGTVPLRYATRSLKSLLRSNGLETNKNYLIIKKSHEHK